MEPLFNFVFKKYIIATKLLKPQINESIKYVNKVLAGRQYFSNDN